MRVVVYCRYPLSTPLYWSERDQPSAIRLLVGGDACDAEPLLGTIREWDGDSNPDGPPVEIEVTVIKALVVRSEAELRDDEVQQLPARQHWIGTIPEIPEGNVPIETALKRNDKFANLLLRWLRVGSRDVRLDLTAVARRDLMQLLDQDGSVLASWIPQGGPHFISDPSLLRPDVGMDMLREASTRCLGEAEPNLAEELLLEAGAHYLRFDFRLCLLLSVLAIDSGLHHHLREFIQRSPKAANALLESPSFLSRLSDDERGMLDKARRRGPKGIMAWLSFSWLGEATLGELIRASRTVALEQTLEKGILDRIDRLNKCRNKIVHPRDDWPNVQEEEAREARSLATRFLRLSGQLSGHE